VSESIRFYLDEHILAAVAKGLRQRGVEVMTLVEANMLGASDEEHLAFARSEHRVLVTHDDDFLRLAAKGTSHAGIVYIPRRRAVGAIIRGLIVLARTFTGKAMRDHVEFL
jgi:predicted nuclease of predicted toxin-antitoxin system